MKRHPTGLPLESGPVGRFPYTIKGFESFVSFVNKKTNNEKSTVLFNCIDSFGWLSEG